MSLEPLRIVMNPTEMVIIYQGESLELNCEATGFPYPHYHWFRDSEQLTDSSDGKLVVPNIGLVVVHCLCMEGTRGTI